MGAARKAIHRQFFTQFPRNAEVRKRHCGASQPKRAAIVRFPHTE
jgi:hypothetical protein